MERSATQIQCMFRCFKASKQKKELIIAQYYSRRTAAANRIKAAYRAWRVRKTKVKTEEKNRPRAKTEPSAVGSAMATISEGKTTVRKI